MVDAIINVLASVALIAALIMLVIVSIILCFGMLSKATSALVQWLKGMFK